MYLASPVPARISAYGSFQSLCFPGLKPKPAGIWGIPGHAIHGSGSQESNPQLIDILSGTEPSSDPATLMKVIWWSWKWRGLLL